MPLTTSQITLAMSTPQSVTDATIQYARDLIALSFNNYVDPTGAIQMAVGVELTPYRVLSSGAIERAPEATRKHFAWDTADPTLPAAVQSAITYIVSALAPLA